MCRTPRTPSGINLTLTLSLSLFGILELDTIGILAIGTRVRPASVKPAPIVPRGSLSKRLEEENGR